MRPLDLRKPQPDLAFYPTFPFTAFHHFLAHAQHLDYPQE